MKEDSYDKLAKALDKLPNGFPKTKSGVEIAILKESSYPKRLLWHVSSPANMSPSMR